MALGSAVAIVLPLDLKSTLGRTVGVMTTNTDSRIDIPTACTLAAADAHAQALEWVDLRELAASVTAVDSGVHMTFPISMAPEVEDLAEREAACCSFLTIRTTRVDDQIALQVTTSNADALPVIFALAGVEIL